jgi:hypothetical protein
MKKLLIILLISSLWSCTKAQTGILGPLVSPPTYTPTSDLLARYTFSEGAGTTLSDASGNGHTATISGSYAWGSDAVLLSAGYIATPSLMADFPVPASVSFTITPSVSYPNGTQASLFRKDNAGGDYVYCYIRTSGELALAFVGSSIAGTMVGPVTSFTAGTAYRITATWDAYVVSLFINGELYLRTKRAGLRPADGVVGPFVFGAYRDGAGASSLHFQGSLSRIVVRGHFMSTAGAVADYNNTTLIPTTQDDLFSQTAHEVLGLGAVGAYDENGAMEPSLIFKDGVYHMYYTALKPQSGDYVHTTCHATATSLEGPWTKDAANPIFGPGKVGNRQLARNKIFYADGYYYLTGVEYGGTGAAYLYRSADLSTWTDLGQFMAIADVPSATMLGNPDLYETKIGGYYYMMMEGLVSGIWENHVYRSTSIEGTWAYVGKANLTIQAGQATGGVMLHHDGSQWHGWYHSGGDLEVTTLAAGNLPTRIFYAKSTDLLTWTDKQLVMSIPDEPFVDHTDQTADPSRPMEAGGRTHLFMSYMQNGSNVKGVIRRHTYEGTLSSLLSQ